MPGQSGRQTLSAEGLPAKSCGEPRRDRQHSIESSNRSRRAQAFKDTMRLGGRKREYRSRALHSQYAVIEIKDHAQTQPR